ncbi:MAG: DUF3426 domain-containing protein [Burkholderiaceae bacterium]|nr:DUF3426 domain-containing protein [Burkholderiaceae bacterium]MCD8517860.1 DUF3426 domain-containing protein [Burkholderiaceae bacterium]MCD8535987.1 DUF3426 domain-containing protein [Burkholderiaceae bacterium]MCD8564602.1 DUF3426 domain-containing protein [Burkholderiaceae bacterium]
MALVTCCPKCASEYEVTTDQLKVHDGLVRCGQCSHVFDGFACLKNALPTLTRKVTVNPVTPDLTASTPVLNVLAEAGDAPPPQLPTTPSTPAEPTAVPAHSPVVNIEPSVKAEQPLPPQDGPFVPSVDRNRATFSGYGRQEPGLRSVDPKTRGLSQDSIEPSLGGLDQANWQSDSREPSLGAIAPAVQPPGTRSTEQRPEPKLQLFGESRLKGDDPSAFGRTVPEFLEDDDEVSESASVMWLVGSIVLALALIIQTLVVFRNDIVAAAPSLRPLLVQLCQPLSCDVSYVRQIDRIFIVGSSLQQAPDAQASVNQRAYVLRLTLQNRSSYPQPWPALMLTLTDASGTAVIKKALLPSAFLPPELLEGPMASRQELGLDIPLIVDGLNISGYELERFFP